MTLQMHLLRHFVRRSLWYRTAIVILAIGGGGCTNTSRRSGVASIHDSSGVTIVENLADDVPDAWRLVVDSTPTVDLGSSSRSDEEFTGNVVATQLLDGRIVVVNGGTREFRIFSADGRWIRSFGGEGGGPGEFTGRLEFVGVAAGDTLLAFDGEVGRLSFFAPDVGFVRSVSWTPAGLPVGSVPRFILPNRRLGVTRTFLADPSTSGVQRVPVPVSIVDFTATLVAMVGVFRGQEIDVTRSDGGVRVGQVLFGKDGFVAALDTLLVVADNDRYNLDLYTQSGHLVRRIRRQVSRVPVTEEAVERLIQQQASDFGLSAQAEQAARQFLVSAPRASFAPAFTQILVSEELEIWVHRRPPSAATDQFEVFNREGLWVSRARLPRGLIPSWIGTDRVLGTWRDPDNVTHVRAYRITKVHM